MPSLLQPHTEQFVEQKIDIHAITAEPGLKLALHVYIYECNHIPFYRLRSSSRIHFYRQRVLPIIIHV